jgi:hypothetical protein
MPDSFSSLDRVFAWTLFLFWCAFWFCVWVAVKG